MEKHRRGGVHRTVGYEYDREKGRSTRRVSHVLEIPLKGVGLLRLVSDSAFGGYHLLMGNLAYGKELRGLGVNRIFISKEDGDEFLERMSQNPEYEFELGGTLTVRLLSKHSKKQPRTF